MNVAPVQDIISIRKVIRQNNMQNRFRGCLYGLACGDALGAQTEFCDLSQIHEKYGASGIQDMPEPALITDDTQMTIALANALCRAGEKPVATLADAMAEEFVAWYKSPENNRAPGNTCLNACRQLAEGCSWRQSGLRNSKGCGANIAHYCRKCPRAFLVSLATLALSHCFSRYLNSQ